VLEYPVRNSGRVGTGKGCDHVTGTHELEGGETTDITENRSVAIFGGVAGVEGVSGGGGGGFDCLLVQAGAGGTIAHCKENHPAVRKGTVSMWRVGKPELFILLLCVKGRSHISFRQENRLSS
jgi:hypothetical protein